MSAEDIVQVLLLGAVVFAFTNNMHSEQITVEGDAGVGVGDDDCRVVDPQEQTIGGMPFRESLVGWELEGLQDVSIRVAKVKRSDAGGVTVPIGKPLRSA